MVQETQELLMKTFKQYINEGMVDKALGAALAFGAIGGGAALMRAASHEPPVAQQTQQVQVAQPQPQQQPQQQPKTTAHDNFHAGLKSKFGSEYDIRKTENGKPGREFGVLSPKAVGPKGQTLDRQAGWAASILNKRLGEWNNMDSKTQSNYIGFSHYLQTKYTPIGMDDPKGLNKNWLGNFTTHYNEHMSFLK